MRNAFFVILTGLTFLLSACRTSKPGTSVYNEKFRPQFHFSPKANWMNDPNGMVYINGNYHLFFQYHPAGTVWGPMHWGHAVSKDLIHWKELPIALYPDSLGTIFSGSAVYDKDNTSGLGRDGKAPIIAIFTHHNSKLESQGRKDFQYQSIAYSLDEGKTWTKYAGNPVVKNPGIDAFRDPKVRWYEAGKKWIMTLATKDRVTFYSSPNLISWTKESEFGEKLGAHGGVWECPDLFPLEFEGKEYWVLLVSLNPGGPNKGSATQYFVGDFDGSKFIPNSQDIKWLDWGTDNYAGVTWSNTGKRKVFLGWMSNWLYAEVVPTEKWRSAMTIPRDLSLARVNNSIYVKSNPAPELGAITKVTGSKTNVEVNNSIDLSPGVKESGGKYRLELNVEEIKDYQVVLSNDAGEEMVFGYDVKNNQYFLDRSKSGIIDFKPEFGSRHFAPRLASDKASDLVMIVDHTSVEIFADKGLSVMTDIIFPSQPFTKLAIRSAGGLKLKSATTAEIKGIWR